MIKVHPAMFVEKPYINKFGDELFAFTYNPTVNDIEKVFSSDNWMLHNKENLIKHKSLNVVVSKKTVNQIV